jgi:hypothetical protein
MKGFGANHFGCERQGRRNGFLRKMGIRPEKVISRGAVCQIFKDHFDGDTGSLDDGPAAANGSIGMDKRFPVHGLNIPHARYRAKKRVWKSSRFVDFDQARTQKYFTYTFTYIAKSA